MAKFQKYLDNFNKTFIQEKLNEGLTVRKISYIVDIPEKRLSEMVRYFDLKVTNKGVTYNVNHKYFNTINTEEKAYFLGFIVADGHVEIQKRKNKYSKRVTFCQGIQDKEIIEKLRDALCPKKPIKWVNNSTDFIKRMDQTNLKFTSEVIVDDLVNNYGVVPNKTHNKEFCIKNIPNDLFRHFIRGFMDGDGHISKNSVELIFTAEPFMYQIARFFKNRGFNYRVTEEVGKTINYYRLFINFNKSNIIDMYGILYKESDIYLNRKKDKLKNRITHLGLEIHT